MSERSERISQLNANEPRVVRVAKRSAGMSDRSERFGPLSRGGHGDDGRSEETA